MATRRRRLPQTPPIAADLIIRLPDGRIVLVERRNPPPGWALPGGFVEVGESVEDAARREAREETCLKVRLGRQFHCYSRPGRDPRGHTVSIVFEAAARGRPRGADDARRAEAFTPEEALRLPLAFDHRRILKDWLAGKY